MRVLVDWENIRVGLHCSGYVANPVLVLDRTFDALESVLGPAWRMESTVTLFFRNGFETKWDEACLARRSDPPVNVVLVWDGKDMADFEIAYAALEHYWKAPSSPRWVISSDNDLASLTLRLSRLATRENAAGTVGLIHQQNPPGILSQKSVGALQVRSIELALPAAMETSVGPAIRHRPCVPWDRGAWALRVRMVKKMDSKVLNRRLSHGGHRLPEDWGEITRGALDAPVAETVDRAVAALWRKGWGGAFPLAEAKERLTNCVTPEEADALLTSLKLAALIRHVSLDLFEVPSLWREGFLHPARRIVLFVASRKDVTRRKIERRYIETFACEQPNDPSPCDTADATEACDHVCRTLMQRNVILSAPGRTLTVNDAHPFVVSTTSTAADILKLLRTPRTDAEAESVVGALGLTAGDRWLRVLREVGLAVRQRNMPWREGELARQPPWSVKYREGNRAPGM